MNNQQEKTLLPSEHIRELKKVAHHLKPVVQIGKKGVTPALIDELSGALQTHELIKIQIARSLKDECDAIIDEIVRETSAQHIDTIGNIVILFRKRDEDSQFHF